MACAKKCYNNYPTIVNNIPKEKNTYNNTLENFAKIDNNLASYQNAIGVSSNLAQICLTYSYNYPDKKYEDYICLLSVLAQVAIDNAKRSYDIDLNAEIELIKENMDIQEHGYPLFYADVQNKKRICVDPKKKKRKQPKKFNKAVINYNLNCPMNCIGSLDVRKNNTGRGSVIPIEEFIIPYKISESDRRRKARAVEDLIEKYSSMLFDYYQLSYANKDVDDEYILLKSDFEDMINEIKHIGLSKNYEGLISWLINRAFVIGSGVKSKIDIMDSKVNKNKSLLLKVLYDINPKCFMNCFKSYKNCPNNDF